MTLIWRPPPDGFPERDDVVASEAFATEYGTVDLPAVTIVIAAYNEADGIGAVLDGMPATVAGPDGEVLDVATIVVVDGGTDDTAAVVREHGTYVCEMPANRGQGAALRLGYHLARTRGARFIVTTDADGQYDIGQLAQLLAPLLAGEADFVTGSRRLGTDHSRDSVRRTGVRVFALLVSVLTRTRVTDTSFGFRAMRADLTAQVTLRQPQYQSSELLIGVLSHGYRVVELPMTMKVRGVGKSKKGNNFVYGLRYARVVFSTWFRERSARSEVNTNRSSTKYLATKVTAYEPK
jgi:glycosyltransferase involved in cell wall biosynthesis